MPAFSKGETLIREGETADRVGIIRRGDVGIRKSSGGGDVVIGKVEAGDFLGEMAVLEMRTHGASAVAETDGDIDWIAPAAFLEMISRDSGLSYRLLRRLSQRISVLDTAYAALAEPAAPAEPTTPPPPVAPSKIEAPPADSDPAPLKAVLKPVGSSLAQSMAVDEIVIDGFPYVVGRHAGQGEPPARHRVDLLLEDAEPLRLSREHFAIVRRDDGLAIEDRRSHLGTIVNDVAIGTYCAADFAMLKPGVNTVVAGGEGSRFRFEIVV